MEKSKLKLPELRVNLEIKNNSFKDSLSMLAVLKDQQEELFGDTKNVRSFDIQVSEKKLNLEDLNFKISKLKDILKDNELRKNDLNSKREIILEASKLTETYLRKNSINKVLVSGLSGIKERLGLLDDCLRGIDTNKEELKIAESRLVETKEKINELKGTYNNLQKELEVSISVCKAIKTKLDELLDGRLLREYSAEYESVLREQAFIQKIISLEAERSKLVQNEPCPLCGSLDHPYINNSPKIDRNKERIDELSFLLEKANGLEAEYGNAERITQGIDTKLTEAYHLIEIQKNLIKANQKELKRINSDLDNIISKRKNLESSIEIELVPYNIQFSEKPDNILALLKEKHDKWILFSSKHESNKEELNKIDVDLKSNSLLIDDSLVRLQNMETDLVFISKDLKTLITERQELFGNKDPDIEENRIKEKLKVSEKTISKLREDEDSAKQTLRDLELNINKLSGSTSSRKLELESVEADFLSALILAGFENELVFREHCLPKTERENISRKAKELDDLHLALETRKADINKKLIEERSGITFENVFPEINQLESTYKELSEQLKEIVEFIAVQRHKLEEDTRIQEEKEDKFKALEKQRIECMRWEALHGLIGSADGKKYRNFAQGLTFEMLVSHANRQLAKMTDRYLLLRDQTNPLELNVVDTWQAGEIRSTSNLSGGESFIVSLALALGLSRMAGRKVRVDSLFLDEGFGTLDDEALETALDTLAGLHQEGKLIGVISHVPALKERIGTQISVVPISGGRSVLEGPGCIKL